MFWVFSLIASAAFVLMKLGAASVWVTVLAVALQATLLVAFGLLVALGWRASRRH